MAWPDAKNRSGLVGLHKVCRQLTPYPGIDQHRGFTVLATSIRDWMGPLSGYSLCVIRIRPSPVTIGPLAVMMT